MKIDMEKRRAVLLSVRDSEPDDVAIERALDAVLALEFEYTPLGDRRRRHLLHDALRAYLDQHYPDWRRPA